jgi:formylglycine-generating enzyme
MNAQKVEATMLVQDKNPLDKARNRGDRAGAKSAPQSAMFEKVLRAYVIGDLSFPDLQSSLTRLLRDGASPEELLRVLRWRESIEPLEQEARDRIIAVLHGTIPDDELENTFAADQLPAATGLADLNQPSAADDEADTSAMSRLIQEFAAEWDTEPKSPPASTAATTQETGGQDLDHKALGIALGQREDDLAALQGEHSRVLGLLEARARSVAQLQEELRALSAQFEESRGALQSQQGKTREIEEVLAERIAAEEAARKRNEQVRGEEAARQAQIHQKEFSTLRETLAARDAAIEQLNRLLTEREAGDAATRGSVAEREAAVEQMSGALAARDGVIDQARTLLAERDAQIAALQRERARSAPMLESNAQLAAKLQSALAAAQARIAALEAAAVSNKAPPVDAVAALRDRDAWADKVLALQRSMDERDAAIEALKQQHAKVVAALMARSKTTEGELRAARGRLETLAASARESEQELEADLEKTSPLLPVFESPPPMLELRRGVEIAEFSAALRRPPPARAQTWKPNAVARTVGVCATIAVLAIVAWVAMHHVPASAKVPEVAATALPTPGTVLRDCPTCPSFTVLPTGRFKQGSADSSASSTVRPLHWVAISHPLAMSTNAVTVDEFRAFATATGRDMQGCDTYDGRWKHQPKNSWENPGFEQTGTHPVTCASWSDAKAYAQWLSEQTGHRYRLPSASEWEFAARAGSEAVQPWNANGSDACANANVADLSAARRYPGWVAFACNDGYVFTAPVGSFKASAFGLNDMLGNVFQWTEDCWTANYKDAPIDGSARADGNCSEHELRGGSWFSSPGYVRADYRNHFAANYRASSAGIRLVRDIAP